MFVRKCYEDAYDDLAKLVDNRTDEDECSYAFLEGSSNIGKSVFIAYFVYRIVCDAMDNKVPAEDWPTFVLKEPNGHVFHMFFDAKGNPIVENIDNARFGSIVVDYFISDSSSDIVFGANKLHLHVTSFSNVDHPKVRKEIVSLGGTLILFCPFTWEEYLMYSTDSDLEEEELQYCYDIFGGAIGLLAAVDIATPQLAARADYLKIARAELEDFFNGVTCEDGEDILTRYSDMIERSAWVLSSELMFINQKAAESNIDVVTKFRSLFF